ncbi:MAG: hypothetical protein ACT4PZ_05575 [Panacagrimonas sp.]
MLEIDESPSFQARSWWWQRLGWAALALFVVAGAAGLLGDGWLSRARATDDTGTLSLEYQRFARMGALTALVIHLPRQDLKSSVAVRIGRDYLDTVLIRSIVPAPARVAADAGDSIFTFDTGIGADAAVIRFQLEPLHPAMSTLSVARGHGRALRPWHLVYP